MGSQCLIYKCFQVTLPTLPCNQLPYLQSTSVGEKSAFPRLANLLVSRHVYSSAVRNTVHSAFWPVEIHDKEWCYRWWWSAKIVLKMKSINLQHKIYSFHISAIVCFCSIIPFDWTSADCKFSFFLLMIRSMYVSHTNLSYL